MDLVSWMEIKLYSLPSKSVCVSHLHLHSCEILLFSITSVPLNWKGFFFFCISACRWWVGEWQKCSASCGMSGLTKRTVLCIQAVSVEEQKALEPSECEHIPKPESLSSCNTHIPCPADWTTGGWSKVSLDWNMRFWFVCNDAVSKRNENVNDSLCHQKFLQLLSHFPKRSFCET